MIAMTLVVFTSSIALADERDDTLEKIERLIESGQVNEAIQLMSKMTTVSHRSPEELFLRARLDSRGLRAVDYLQASLKGSESPRLREKTMLNLARYYQAAGDLSSLKGILRTQQGEFLRSYFSTEFSRLRVYLAERENDLNSARRLNRRLAKSASKADTRDWANLNLARYDLQSSSSRRKGRSRALVISRQGKGTMVAPALTLIAAHDVKVRDYDAAALNFSFLREAFPHAVGSYDLIDLLSDVSERRTRSSGEAEKLLGSYYSVQVGVFSNKGNAKGQKKRFENYGEKVEISRKVISGSRYYAVYAGRFSTMEEALAYKRTLERSEKELFTVVMRDK